MIFFFFFFWFGKNREQREAFIEKGGVGVERNP